MLTFQGLRSVAVAVGSATNISHLFFFLSRHNTSPLCVKRAAKKKTSQGAVEQY
jgi:hypothetical protein